MIDRATRARSDVHDEIEDRLARMGQRYTRGRRSLIEALIKADGPVTLPALLELDRSLAQSSAYRNLVVMEEAAVVRRLAHGERAHYELSEELTSHHHHLICESCGLISDVTFDARLERTLGQRFRAIADAAGFVPRHHAVDLYGRCATCTA